MEKKRLQDRKKLLLLGSILCCMIFVSGCLPKRRFVDETQIEAQRYLFHTIRYSGETLGLLASWYTGSVLNWTKIQDVNPGLRPERMSIGEVIKIPRGLIRNNRPLTRDVVRKAMSSESQISKQEKKEDKKGGEEAEAEAKRAEKKRRELEKELQMEALVVSSPPALSPPSPPKSVPLPEKSSEVSLDIEDKKEDAERERLLEELLRQ